MEYKERYGNKDVSHMARMGFQDSDLRTDTHDEIFVRLLDNSIINKVAKIIYKTEEIKCVNEYRECTGSVDLNITEWKLELEYPVVAGEELIGYRYQGGKRYIIGYIDLLAYIRKPRTIAIAIEIKIKIDNIGELIRQINTYRTHLFNTREQEITYVVIAPKITDIQRSVLEKAKIILIDTEKIFG